MAVNVRIGELVLHGFDPRDGDAIGDALRAELARTLGGAALQSQAYVDGGEFALPDTRAVSAAARGIADAVRKGTRG